MKVLITGGGTFTPIDKVRGIANVFNGRTSVQIFEHISEQFSESTKEMNDVTLLIQKNSKHIGNAKFISHEYGTNLLTFHTYDDLYRVMVKEITTGEYGVIIHSAAVSDYKLIAMYEDASSHTRFGLRKIDEVGKYKSNYDDLYLRLKPTEKIVDKIRNDWNFQGVLVKFKLEVGIEDEELISIAKESRVKSEANIIIANCLEWAKDRAYVITEDSVTSVKRDNISHYLYGLICKIG